MRFLRTLAALLLFVLYLLIVAGVARADLVWQNYFPGSATNAAINQVTQFDTDGNQIQFHDGTIMQVGTDLYIIGNDWSCGMQWSADSPFCGIKTYKLTTSGWQYRGRPFDPNSGNWQAWCSGLASGGVCFNARMAGPVPSTGKYVLWFGQSPRSTGGSPSGYVVTVCDGPEGPCGAPTQPTLTCSMGDHTIFMDDDGTGYIAHAGNGSCGSITIERLNSSYTDGSGTAAATGLTVEGVGMFKRSGVYYLTFSSACGLCNSSTVSYGKSSAANPLSGWSAATQINADACQGQSTFAAHVVGSGAQDTYLIVTDQWTNQGNNQGVANNYVGALSFTGTNINSFSCINATTIAGFPAITAAVPPPTSVIDQTSMPTLGQMLGTTSTYQRMQTFVPTQATLTTLYASIAQGCFNFVCGLNGNLSVRLAAVDGSGNPVTTLATVTLAPAQLSWGGQWTPLNFNYSGLTPGTTYGIYPYNASSQGQILFGIYTQPSGNPYPAGKERFSSNGGSSWSDEPGEAFMFASFPAAPVIVPPPVVTAQARGLRLRR